MSTRISKTLAEEVAKNLLKSKNDEIEDLGKVLIKICTDLASNSIDPELLKSYNKYMEFFHVSNQVALQNYKEDSIHVTIKEYFPCSKGQYRLWINLNDDQFDSIKKVEDTIALKSKEYKKALNIVSETIFGLRTSLQVQKHFPEAYVLLPKETNGSMLPMVNLDQVRALVQ